MSGDFPPDRPDSAVVRRLFASLPAAFASTLQQRTIAPVVQNRKSLPEGTLQQGNIMENAVLSMNHLDVSLPAQTTRRTGFKLFRRSQSMRQQLLHSQIFLIVTKTSSKVNTVDICHVVTILNYIKTKLIIQISLYRKMFMYVAYKKCLCWLT